MGFLPRTRRLQCLATTYSSNAWALVPSALSGFTAEFEMGSGGSQTLWSPSNEAGEYGFKSMQRSLKRGSGLDLALKFLLNASLHVQGCH